MATSFAVPHKKCSTAIASLIFKYFNCHKPKIQGWHHQYNIKKQLKILGVIFKKFVAIKTWSPTDIFSCSLLLLIVINAIGEGLNGRQGLISNAWKCHDKKANMCHRINYCLLRQLHNLDYYVLSAVILNECIALLLTGWQYFLVTTN